MQSYGLLLDRVGIVCLGCYLGKHYSNNYGNLGIKDTAGFKTCLNKNLVWYRTF